MKKRWGAFFLAICVGITSIPMDTSAQAAKSEKWQLQEEDSESGGQQLQEYSESESQQLQEYSENESQQLQEYSENESQQLQEYSISEDQTIRDSIAGRTGSLERGHAYRISPSPQRSQDQTVGYSSKARGSAAYGSAWDAYSSNYIYNRLEKSERKFWDELDDLAQYYLVNEDDAIAYPIGFGDEEAYAPAESMWADYHAIGNARAQELLMMFLYANPQYYFFGADMLYDGTKIAPCFYPQFRIGSQRALETASLKAQLDAWVAKINKGGTQEKKAKIAHDLIIEKVQYDSNYGTSKEDNPYHQSAYSVFLDDHTVCAGYAKAFEMLMNGVGVDTMAVTSIDHAWNAININDSWYYVDCTWDDLDGASGQEGMYRFFNRSKSKLLSFSSPSSVSHSEEACYEGCVPPCTLDSGATDSSIGACPKPSSKTKTPKVSFEAVKNGVEVTISCDTSGADVYYTVDGTAPSSNATRSYLYRKPFVIKTSANVQAIAVRDTYSNSALGKGETDGKSHKITFDTKGAGSIEAQYLLTGKKVKKPNNPSKSGYAFGGWYADSAFKNSFDFQQKVTKSMTLYAYWLKISQLKFNANGGSVKAEPMRVTYSKKYARLPSAKKKGYQFLGWYTKKSGGTKVKSGATVQIKKNTTLYAHWKKITVKPTKIKKLKNVKGRKLQVTLQKVSGAVGYQIRYSKKPNMKSAKSVYTKKLSKTLTKLSKKKAYYVQVRAYKIDSAGKKVYGSWSKKQKVVIKR